MSLKLEEVEKALRVLGQLEYPHTLSALLRQIAIELVELRDRELVVFDTTGSELSQLRSRLPQLHERLDAIEKDLRVLQTSDEHYENALHVDGKRIEMLDSKLKEHARRMESLEGIVHEPWRHPANVESNTVSYGAAVRSMAARELPKWTHCMVFRTGNSIAVTGCDSRSVMALSTLTMAGGDTYTFDDLEEAGHFVAAVLTAGRPR